MQHLNNKYYEAVRVKRYVIRPTETFVLRERKEPKCLRIQYQIVNETKIRRSQKL